MTVTVDHLPQLLLCCIELLGEDSKGHFFNFMAATLDWPCLISNCH